MVNPVLLEEYEEIMKKEKKRYKRYVFDILFKALYILNRREVSIEDVIQLVQKVYGDYVAKNITRRMVGHVVRKYNSFFKSKRIYDARKGYLGLIVYYRVRDRQ